MTEEKIRISFIRISGGKKNNILEISEGEIAGRRKRDLRNEIELNIIERGTLNEHMTNLTAPLSVFFCLLSNTRVSSTIAHTRSSMCMHGKKPEGETACKKIGMNGQVWNHFLHLEKML